MPFLLNILRSLIINQLQNGRAPQLLYRRADDRASRLLSAV